MRRSAVPGAAAVMLPVRQQIPGQPGWVRRGVCPPALWVAGLGCGRGRVWSGRGRPGPGQRRPASRSRLGVASATWAVRDRAAAAIRTVASGRRWAGGARLRRRISSPAAVGVSSEMMALAQPNQPLVPGGDVVHGPVVDVGEGRGSGHAADDQHDDDLDDVLGAVGLWCGHWGSPPQRCWAAWRVTPSRAAMSAQL